MNLLKRLIPAVVSVAAVAALATALVQAVPASAVPHTVANKVYDAWVVTSFNPPGTAPFHDCARFTDKIMCLDGCGDCGNLVEAPLSGSGGGTIWHGRVPCGGLGLGFIGTSYDGTMGISTIGAEGIGQTQATNFGLTGAQNSACSLTAADRAANRYSRP